MRLSDHYDGSDDPFEGDRTITWRSLPANAVVTKAAVTLTPVRPPGRNDYTETLRFAAGGPAYGATIGSQATSVVEIDFHARRTAIAFTGLTASPPTALSVDVGGGVFLAVGKDGTIPAQPPQGWDLTGGLLPGITAFRLKLTGVTPSGPSADLTGTAIDIKSMPSNLTLRFGTLPPFWSSTGILAVPAMTPDVTSAVQRALANATVEDGYYAIPLVVHSDAVGRVSVTLDVEYLGAAPLIPAGVPEVVLQYDYSSLPKADKTALQATLPAGAAPISPRTAMRIRGAFASSRVTDGPTGATNEATTIVCSAGATIAQPVIPSTDVDVSAVDLFTAADGPAARLALDLRIDDDGKPGQTSMLAKPLTLDLSGGASGQRQWASAQVTPPAQLKGQERYWIVVQALDGEAQLGVDADPDPARLAQVSKDSGFSWRLTGLGSPVLSRLRTVPDRFHMPVDFAVGAGRQQQRVSLSGYDPAGKIDMIIDRPEIAAAVQSYVAQAVPPPCAQAELLSNTDFSQWSASGNRLAYKPPAIQPEEKSALVIVDTFFDTSVSGPTIDGSVPSQLAFSADGLIIFSLGTRIDAIDARTYTRTPLVTDVTGVSAIAVARQGGTFYLLRRERATSHGQGELAAVDPITGKQTTVFEGRPDAPLNDAEGLALSPDGRTAYVTCSSNPPAIVAVELQTGTQKFRIDLDARPLAFTVGSQTIVVVAEEPGGGQQSGQAQQAPMLKTFDALSGKPEWSAPLPVQADAPIAVAIAADGTSIHAVGVAPDSSGVGAGESVALNLNLITFDERGSPVTPATLTFPAPTARMADCALAVKPQGDRIYVSEGPLAINPQGDRLVSANKTIAVMAVGNRALAAWTLTAGAVVPVRLPGEPAGVAAQLDDGALSQVVAVAPTCFHDLTVNARVSASGGSPDAAAETLWLDANGALLRSDSLALPASELFVTRRTRAEPPPGSAQAEVRISITGGSCVFRTVCLKSSDELLRDDAWEPDPATPASIVLTSDAGGTIYRNVGTADAAQIQQLALDPGATYELDFSGSATPGASKANPYLELRYSDASGAEVGAPQRIAIIGGGFAGRPAQFTVPPASSAADLRIVLPADATLTVERLQVLAQHLQTVPFTFIAQSPGELHVSSAQVVYDVAPLPGPSLPPGGLSPPTPPGMTPGDKACTDTRAAPQAPADASGRRALPPPVQSGAMQPGSKLLNPAGAAAVSPASIGRTMPEDAGPRPQPDDATLVQLSRQLETLRNANAEQAQQIELLRARLGAGPTEPNLLYVARSFLSAMDKVHSEVRQATAMTAMTGLDVELKVLVQVHEQQATLVFPGVDSRIDPATLSTVRASFAPDPGTVSPAATPPLAEPPPHPTAAERQQHHFMAFVRKHRDPSGLARAERWRQALTQFRQMTVAAVVPTGPAAGTALQWNQVGPAPLRVNPGPDQQFMGTGPLAGQVTDITVDPGGSTDQTLYIATNDGGVWKSTDGGQSWAPKTDSQPSLSMGAVALDPADSTIIYGGTGNLYNNGFFKAVGIYKSTDGGDTWVTLDPKQIFTTPISTPFLPPDVQAPRGVLHIVAPSANTVLVATMAGLFRSVDGGQNFGKNTPAFDDGNPVLDGFITDLHVDTADASSVYAAVAAAGIFKSADGGATFPTNLFTDPPFTADGFGNISFGQSTLPDGKTLYASVTVETGLFAQTYFGLFTSTDSGSTWSKVASNITSVMTPPGSQPQIGYDHTLGVDPQDPKRVYLGLQELQLSTDSGQTFAGTAVTRGKVHWDHHALVFSPKSHWGASPSPPTALYVGTDGGISTSSDGGSNWANLNEGVATNLFFGIDIGRGSALNNGHTYGGTQDCGTIEHRPEPTFPGTDWRLATDGDGAAAAVDFQNPKVVYGTRNGGFIASNDGGNTWSDARKGMQSISLLAVDPNSPGTVQLSVDANGLSFVDPSSSGRIYASVGNQLFQSTNAGAAFTSIGTFPDPITALAATRQDSNVIWVGLRNGQVQFATNATAGPGSITWTSPANQPGAAASLAVGGIAIDPQNTANVVAVYAGCTGGIVTVAAPPPAHLTRRVFLTSDSGATPWKDIGGTNGGDPSQNIPDMPLNAVVIDPSASPHGINVASVFGVLRTADSGATWQVLGTGLPMVDCTSLVLDATASGTLIRVGTYGRSVYELTLPGGAGPQVSEVSPAGGPEAGQSTVTITGTGLGGATGVRFGGTAAASFTADSDTQVTAMSPAGTGTVDVTVTTPAGTSATGAAADQFTYAPAPQVSGVSPAGRKRARPPSPSPGPGSPERPRRSRQGG